MHQRLAKPESIMKLLSSIILFVSMTALVIRPLPDGGLNPSRTSNPNIIVILADDMGYGDPGCYNPRSKIPTPNLDRMAADGLRLLDAHSPGSWCVPSRYGLLTGRYPARTTFNWQQRSLIGPGQLTLATLLKKHGYATACVGKWHLGFDSVASQTTLPTTQRLRGGPLDHGFDSFFGLYASLDIPPYGYIENDHYVHPLTDSTAEHQSPQATTPISGAFWRAGPMSLGFRHQDVMKTLTEKAITMLNTHYRQQSSVPFFLYLALTGPHTPWLPDARFQGKSRAGDYGDFVMQVDDTVGQIMATLKRQGVTDNTLVIFTSDNGPVWFAEDITRYGHRAAGNWRGMKIDQWEGGHRVPFIAQWPGQIPAGKTRSDLFCLTDLLATIAGVLSHPLPERTAPDSYNLLPVLLNQRLAQPIRRELLIENRTFRQDNWKYIQGSGAGALSTRYGNVPASASPSAGELYNLQTDPLERINLAASDPERVLTLAEKVRVNSVKDPAGGKGH